MLRLPFLHQNHKKRRSSLGSKTQRKLAFSQWSQPPASNLPNGCYENRWKLNPVGREGFVDGNAKSIRQ